MDQKISLREYALDLAMQLFDMELYNYILEYRYRTYRNLQRRISAMEEELHNRFSAVQSIRPL